jgi:transposase
MSDTEFLVKPEPVRRLEVFTGSGRRRAWTAEQKAQIVAETYAGGESVSALARRHGLTPQQLFAWRRAAREQAVPGRRDGLSFAPVMVERPGSGATMIEIIIGTIPIRVRSGCDMATLQTVLRGLTALS